GRSRRSLEHRVDEREQQGSRDVHDERAPRKARAGRFLNPGAQHITRDAAQSRADEDREDGHAVLLCRKDNPPGELLLEGGVIKRKDGITAESWAEMRRSERMRRIDR